MFPRIIDICRLYCDSSMHFQVRNACMYRSPASFSDDGMLPLLECLTYCRLRALSYSTVPSVILAYILS
jgi:hypothetical protein